MSEETRPAQAAGTKFTAPISPSGGGDAVSQDLILETRNQIRSLVDEISQLAESQCTRGEFFEGFLTRLIQALAAVGGAVWQRDEAGQLQLEFQINLAAAGVVQDEETAKQHGQLVARLMESAEPALIAPKSGGEGVVGNPSHYLLVAGPLEVDQKTVGLVEIFQRADSGPTTQRGYLRFVVQMCKLAGGYLKSHQLRQFGLQQQIWQRLQQFVGEVHQSLDLKRTVYAIANEGRRVIECDRCSVAVYRGRRCTIDAVSGLDSLERRADQVKRLARLVAAVVRGKQPLWYDGDDSDLPPQIESILHDYLDLAHAKMLAIIPLRRTRDVAAEAAATRRRERLPDPPVLGALVIEQLVDASRPPALVKRVETVAEHASFALSNSVDHNSIFLAPLWRTIGKSRVLVTARNLPKTLAVAACILALIGALWLIPYPFTLGASGHLTPVDRQEIFAQVDGILEEISVPDDPAAIVEQGHVLARMTNIDLQSEVESLQGRLNTKREQINRLNRAINSSGDLSRVERIELEGELSAAESEAASLQVELQIKQRQLEHLVVTAPQRGHVVNWQVRQNLLRRPVKSGQNLMTLVDPNSEWQLELEVPERRVAHLLRAAEAEGQPLQVTFTLASHPGRQFQGTVLEIDKKLDVRSDQGNVALVRVDLDETRLPPELLRTGTRVTAKVHAGRRKLGYVWFRELLETIQTYWQYWF